MTGEKESVLIVDDEPSIRRLLTGLLSGEGYRCREAGNSDEAMQRLGESTFSLVLLDNKMPGLPGIELLPRIRSAYPDTPVIMATATTDIDVAIECIRRGAYDYVTKPLALQEVILSVRRAIEKRRLELENRDYRQNLEKKVAEQARKLRQLSLNAITALASALEAKDSYTSGHSRRVAEIGADIARQMDLPQDVIDRVYVAGLVHDLGKIGVGESVLNKPTSLSDEEQRLVRKHPDVGEHILSPMGDDEGILKIVRAHHERFDGEGYPDGLKGDLIPLGARILAVADAYEAMTSERPYRAALTDAQARVELERCRGAQFDSAVVEAFLKLPRPAPRTPPKQSAS
jgi:response regulator RpfG family c-di-GMP phosphodiesterase